MSDAKAFPLDSVEMLWNEYRMRHKRSLEDNKWLEEFKATIKQVAGDASEFKLRGVKVAMLVPGNLKKSLLAKEQPDLVKEYTRPVFREEFDQEAFAKDHPELYEKYRAQAFKLSDGAPELGF